MTHDTLVSPFGRRWATLIVASLLLTACRGRTPRKFVTAPSGLGAEMHLRVPGALNAAPTITARWPFVVVAWTATTPADTAVYVATSADNGASFSPPRPIEATRERTAAGPTWTPRIMLGWPKVSASYELLMPDLHVVWPASTGSDASLRAVKSTDAGLSFVDEAMEGERPADAPRQPERVPSAGQLHHAVADVASANLRGAYDECGTLLVAWDETTSGVSRVAMRRFVEGPKDVFHALQTVAVSDRNPAAGPNVASLLGGVIVAWTSGEAGDAAIALRRVGLESICQAQDAAGGRVSEVATP